MNTFKLVATQKTPHILPKDRPTGNVASRLRKATCGGVAWLGKDCIATLNLLGNCIHTYKFDRGTGKLSLKQVILDNPPLIWPDNMKLSRDRSLLLVANGGGGAVNIFESDPLSCTLNCVPIASVSQSGDNNCHGVAISPDNTRVIYSTIDNPGVIRVCRAVRENGNLQVIPFQEIINGYAPYKPKGLDFSKDGKFVVVAYGLNAGNPEKNPKSFVVVFPFDPELGIDPTPVDRSTPSLEMVCAEDLTFSHDYSHIVIPDQGTDEILFQEFNGSTGKLGQIVARLSGTNTNISFPHGTAISEDGEYLVVGNYGNDSATIYKLGQ